MDVVTLRFHVRSRDGDHHVHLESEGFEPAEGPLEVDLLGNSRLAKITACIESNYAESDHLADVGSQLWASLLTGPIAARFEEIAHATQAHTGLYRLCLSLPPEIEQLPWETLYDERQRAFLAGHPRYCIVRDPPAAISPARPRERSSGPLAVLVVIPEGSGLQTEQEFRNLRYAVDRLGDAIRLDLMQGSVTLVALAEKLQQERWDVVHFVGHGRLDERGRIEIRLNDESVADLAHWVEAEPFANAFLETSVQLAVLNCCRGGATLPNPQRSLSSLGPALMRAGLRAVVAMRYEIEDTDALKFSTHFYGGLLSAADAGRVDAAVVRARRALYLSRRRESVRGFVTPVLYLAPDFDRLPVETGARPGLKRAAAAAATAAPELRLPDGLVDAVREQRCVPIVGPGLSRAGAMRDDESPPPGPRELAEVLARTSGFPTEIDLQGGTALLADWAEELLLQRVCQHFQFVHRDEPFLLIRAVREAYASSLPPPVLQSLASLPTPGLIYTHFDGLVAQACDRLGRAVRVINRIDEEMPGEDGETLLVHLRGTITDDDSLVLTEEDHETLWHRMASLSSQVTDLIHLELGRSLLFLGISPRDMLLRRFLNRMMPHGTSRTQGPMYFACAEHSLVDEAYWSRYGMKWIDETPDVVVSALCELMDNRS